MNNKVMSILFGNLDKETRHYICRRMVHPERKNWPGPKQKKPDETTVVLGQSVKEKKKRYE